MLDQDTFFIWGKPIVEFGKYTNTSMAIAAYSSQFKEHELVDTMYFKGTQTHYALNLPEGTYILLIYADINEDQVFDQSEVVGIKDLVLNTVVYPDKLGKNVDVEIKAHTTLFWPEKLFEPQKHDQSASLYYPTGTIRPLSDPIFDQEIATMGMYDPASFLEIAPTMFYALEEDVAYKIPVIFVHGIDGSSRSFEAIVDKMDKDIYQPWFFYYPSGGDLEQLSDFFYNIFLSGSVIPTRDMPMIVVAHSMGGLIVRDALNRYQQSDKENHIELFVSIATPFAGHPSAALGEKHGLLVLPAWQDLNPSSQFIKELYRTTLPQSVHHQLLYAYNNSSLVKVGENSDGVVPLSSQLHVDAQKQSRSQFGFNSNHSDILDNNEMIANLLRSMALVKNTFPDSHLKILHDGGIDLEQSEAYSRESKYILGYAGKYLILLVKGEIQPINEQQEIFIRAVRGETTIKSDFQREFVRFMSDCESGVFSCEL